MGIFILQVVRPLVELRTGAEQPWQAPAACPCCGGPLQVETGAGGAVSLWCRNPSCGGQASRQVREGAVQVCEIKVGRKREGGGLTLACANVYSPL